MKCTKCGNVNTEESLFCSLCGNELTSDLDNSESFRFCPACNAHNSLDADFCSKCGKAMTKSESSAKKNDTVVYVNDFSLSWKTLCIIAGILGTAIGGMIAIADIYDYENSWFDGYNYEPPLTGHEISIILLIVVSIIVFIIGISLSPRNNRKM